MAEILFKDILLNFGLAAKYLVEVPADWDNVAANAGYAPVSYTRSMVAYQAAYMGEAAEMYKNQSLIIYHDGRPAAIWPFGLKCAEERWESFSNGGPILPPLFVHGLAEKSRKAVVEGCLAAVDELCKQIDQKTWQGCESIRSNGAGFWHRRIMEKGGTVQVCHELYVDLSLGIDVIRSGVRKSYKSLLSMGNKLWDTSVFITVPPDVFAEFRDLHCSVAGRVTRAIDTWNLQEHAINDGNAFLIILRDKDGKMVGGGLFHLSLTEGLYAVGAYDRSLFELPLGHVVQMKAIEHMKNLGLKWYKIGDRPYPADAIPPTEKELSIARFKEGFATHMFLKVTTSCPLTSVE